MILAEAPLDAAPNLEAAGRHMSGDRRRSWANRAVGCQRAHRGVAEQTSDAEARRTNRRQPWRVWGKGPEFERWGIQEFRNLGACQEGWNTALDNRGKDRGEKGHGIPPALQTSEVSFKRLHGSKDVLAL